MRKMFGIPLSGFLLASVLTAFSFIPGAARAQNVFPCGGGANEQQIGMDTNGPVAVPLCIERPSASQSDGAGNGRTRYVPPPGTPPPRGWKQVFGAWKTFEVGRRPDSDRYEWDYVISLGHSTQGEALAAVRALCLARRPIFAESSPSTCEGVVIQHPFVQVIRYPDNEFFSGNTSPYYVNTSNMPSPPGLVERTPGRWDYCSGHIKPEGQCANLLAYLVNGEVPEQGRNSRR